MDWADEGIVLSARKHGESAAIVTLLTRAHGRHLGLAHGGAGRRGRGVYQPGNRVTARWRARLAEYLGTYVCELERSVAAAFLDDPARLAGLSAACAVAEVTLPERESHPAVFEAMLALLEAFETPGWDQAYVRWELGLLQELGFGLDASGRALRPPLTRGEERRCRAVRDAFMAAGPERPLLAEALDRVVSELEEVAGMSSPAG